MIAATRVRTAELPNLPIRVRGTECGHVWVATTIRATMLRAGETARIACPQCGSEARREKNDPHGNEVLVPVVAAVAGRTCAVATCRQLLSVWNNEDICFACQMKEDQDAAAKYVIGETE